MSVTLPEGLAIELDEDCLGARRDRAFKRADIVGIGPHHVPAKTLEGVAELVDRSAVQFARCYELIARHQELLQHHHLRGMAGSDRERRGAAFEGRDALFQHRVGRVADAGVDVAERLQPEQRGGVIGVVEHERSGLIDRRRPGAGGGIGLRARMHGEGRKSGKTIGHVVSFRRPASARGRLDSASLDEMKSGATIAAEIGAVKAARCPAGNRKNSGFAVRLCRNNRFAIASRNVVLVFRGAIRCRGLAAADAHPIEREAHALGRQRRALRAQRA